MSYKPAYTLPEKAKIVLEFLEAGNTVEFEGRKMKLNQEYMTLVTDAKFLKFLGGPPVERSGPVGINLSFHRFLKMLHSMTFGDISRMENILRDQKLHYPTRAE